MTFLEEMLFLPQHVNKNILDMDTGCWHWRGADSGAGRGGGYGRVSYLGRTTAVHLLVWRLTGQRKLRRGEQLDHECCNRRCVNPAHLKPRTQSVNIRLANKRRKSNDPRRPKHPLLQANQAVL